MANESLIARTGLWRLTRTPTAKRLYDGLADAGLVVASLDSFVRLTADPPSPEHPLTFDAVPASEWIPDRIRGEPLAPDDVIVRAREDGETVGYCCLSDRRVYVPELRRRMTFGGAYLWRLYVEPPARQRGIATALVRHAVRAAADRFDADDVTALVAPDNVPSRRTFESVGFAATERHTYVSGPGVERRRRRPLRTGT
jgi:ribosomal protein S18 acetylase RimI-like enzyme